MENKKNHGRRSWRVCKRRLAFLMTILNDDRTPTFWLHIFPWRRETVFKFLTDIKHVNKFWPVGSKWKWWEQYPKSILKGWVYAFLAFLFSETGTLRLIKTRLQQLSWTVWIRTHTLERTWVPNDLYWDCHSCLLDIYTYFFTWNTNLVCLHERYYMFKPL